MNNKQGKFVNLDLPDKTGFVSHVKENPLHIFSSKNAFADGNMEKTKLEINKDTDRPG